jgi:hypothetical protein
MGPAATTTAHPAPVPAARLSARCREHQGRLRRRRCRPGSARSLTRPPAHPRSAAIGEQGRPRPRPLHQACGPVRHARNRREHGQKPVKPRLTRSRSFRDDTEEVTGSNPVRPTPFFEILSRSEPKREPTGSQNQRNLALRPSRRASVRAMTAVVTRVVRCGQLLHYDYPLKA